MKKKWSVSSKVCEEQNKKYGSGAKGNNEEEEWERERGGKKQRNRGRKKS